MEKKELTPEEEIQAIKDFLKKLPAPPADIEDTYVKFANPGMPELQKRMDKYIHQGEFTYDGLLKRRSTLKKAIYYYESLLLKNGDQILSIDIEKIDQALKIFRMQLEMIVEYIDRYKQGSSPSKGGEIQVVPRMTGTILAIYIMVQKKSGVPITTNEEKDAIIRKTGAINEDGDKYLSVGYLNKKLSWVNGQGRTFGEIKTFLRDNKGYEVLKSMDEGDTIIQFINSKPDNETVQSALKDK